MITTDTHQKWLTLLVILSGLLARLLLSPNFLLVPDEANYWQWSRYLALGYHDHPPMLAWTIWLSTTLLGQSEFAVRLPTVLGSAIFSLYLSGLAGRLFSQRCALHTALICQLLLLINGSALIATPDGLLLPCWAAACYHGYRAVSSRTAAQWLLTGCWFGLGMLSKYTMLLFLPCLFFAILAIREYRTSLASCWPWLGLLISAFFFSPVLFWNAENHWATFRHVLYQGGLENKALFTLAYVGDFLGSQALLLSPLLFLLLLAAWCRPRLRAALPPAKAGYLLWMSLPGFVVFLLLSLHVRIYGNWPAPVYACGIILVAALWAPGGPLAPARSRTWKLTLATAAVITLPVLIQVVYPLLPLPLSLDRTARETAGWDALGTEVARTLAAMPRPEETFIFGLRYQYASELAFYTPGRPRTVSINRWARPNVYDFWFDDQMLLGQDGVGIFTWKPMAPLLAERFTSVEPLEEISLKRVSPWFGSQEVQKLYLFRGHGFKGGIRWQPRDQGDIRATGLQTEEKK
ncbi:glycosyltransferase family 39 protein [Desulfogranum mediterraneum]|uniref:glycosyltransferase family 39 protein n=1 Tax=Desulfogranum mediterraneum TaxID=160661 RepID=UPI0003FE695E|nr:glycosyltransferase family 39 protein [Desulfogranum mediterraneum]